MHEVIKKSFKEIENWLNEEIILDQSVRIVKEGILKNVINSHITLAEEKIKELEGEKKTDKLPFTDGLEGIGEQRIKRAGYNAHIQEEIDKWKQFISELKGL